MVNKIASTQEFFDFCNSVLDNIDNSPSDSVVDLKEEDFNDLKDYIKEEVFSPEAFGEGDDVSYILEHASVIIRDFLDDNVGMEIISTNLYAEGYEIIQFADTDNPLEWVRRSLVLEVESCISNVLRTKIKDVTGLDPYNQPWELI